MATPSFLCERCRAPLAPGTAACGRCGFISEATASLESKTLPTPVDAFGARLQLPQRLAGMALEVALLVITIGVGWIAWLLFSAQKGMTPAGKLRDEVFVDRAGHVAKRQVILFREAILLLAWVGVAWVFQDGLVSLFPAGPNWLIEWTLPIIFLTAIFAELLSVFLPSHTRYLDRILGLRLASGAGHTFR